MVTEQGSRSGRAGHRRRWRTVRVRITLAATVVTGVAVSLAGWMLVRSVEDNQLGALRHDTDDLLDQLTAGLAAGQTPLEAVQAADMSTAFVQVQYEDGPSFRLAAAGGASVVGSDTGEPTSGATTPSGADQGDPTRLPTGRIPDPAEDLQPGVTGDSRPDPGLGAGAGGVPIGSMLAYPLEQTTRTVDTPYGPATVTVGTPIDQVARSIHAVRRALTVGLPVLVGMVALAAWWLVGRALRPVELIRAEAEAIGGSTLHRRVPEPPADDEVGRLAHTMNAMLGRLDNSARRQRQFVSDASHELRSPVAAIRTDVEVALHEGDRANWPKVARAVLAEETRLETLISDLLLLAAEDEAPVTVPGTPVDLRQMAVEESARAHLAPVTVTVTLDEPTPTDTTAATTEPASDCTVVGSRPQLERALRNLVDNAARHAHSEVRIGITSGAPATNRSWVQVRVDDDGPGIPPAERERIFDRFTRLDDGRTRDTGGAGLGLAVARSIVTRHGGFLWADTSPLGGARLVISLPRSRSNHPPPVVGKPPR